MSRKVFRRAVTETSTTLSDLGEIGDKRFEDGKTYRLVYTVATQADKAILALDSTDASLASYQVQVVPASDSPVFGLNATGASIAGSTYFWCQVEGPFTADSTVIGNLASVDAEKALTLDSDKKIAEISIATSDHDVPILGQSLVSITSVDSTQGTPVIYLKCMGA